MKEKIVLQIVPRLPPAICGLSDYSKILADSLLLRHGFKTHFIVTDSSWKGVTPFPHFVSKCNSPLSRSLKKCLTSLPHRPDAIILHYVGYAYSPKAIPWWLPTVLKTYLDEINIPFTVMFHELDSTSSWNKTAYWTNFLQRKIIVNLSRLATNIKTNSNYFYSKLKQWDSSSILANTKVVQVFSNLGETVSPKKISERSNRLCWFAANQNVHLPERLVQMLPFLHDNLQINELLILRSFVNLIDVPTTISVRQVGPLDHTSVAKLLAETNIGYFDYYPKVLGKSGIFASFCAHGVTPLTSNDLAAENDGILNGVHYLNLENISENYAKIEFIARSAHEWYQGHTINVTADSYAADWLSK